jgi:hypothetical protein
MNCECCVLEQKLTDEEQRVLDNALYDLEQSYYQDLRGGEETL